MQLKTRKGYTLVEIMAVVAILVILIMIVMGEYSERVEKARRINNIVIAKTVQEEFNDTLYRKRVKLTEVVAGTLSDEGFHKLQTPQVVGELEDYRVYTASKEITPDKIEADTYSEIFKEEMRPIYVLNPTYVDKLSKKLEGTKEIDVYLADKDFNLYLIQNGKNTKVTTDGIVTTPIPPDAEGPVEVYEEIQLPNPTKVD